MIVCNCLAGGCVGLQAGSGGLQAAGRQDLEACMQSEGRDWTLVLGSSLGLVLGCMACVPPVAVQNVDKTLFFEENLGPKFQFQGSQVLNLLIDLSI